MVLGWGGAIRTFVANGRFTATAWPRQPYSQCANRNTKQTDNPRPRTSENYPFSMQEYPEHDAGSA